MSTLTNQTGCPVNRLAGALGDSVADLALKDAGEEEREKTKEN